MVKQLLVGVSLLALAFPALADDLSPSSFGPWNNPPGPSMSSLPGKQEPPTTIPRSGKGTFNGGLTGTWLEWSAAGGSLVNGKSQLVVDFGKNSVASHFTADVGSLAYKVGASWIDLTGTGKLDRSGGFDISNMNGTFGFTTVTNSSLHPPAVGCISTGAPSCVSAGGSGKLSGPGAQTASGSLSGTNNFIHPNSFTATFTAKR